MLSNLKLRKWIVKQIKNTRHWNCNALSQNFSPIDEPFCQITCIYEGTCIYEPTYIYKLKGHFLIKSAL